MVVIWGMKVPPMACLAMQYMDKLDDSRKKGLEDMLAAARSGGARPAQAAAPAPSLRSSQVGYSVLLSCLSYSADRGRLVTPHN